MDIGDNIDHKDKHGGFFNGNVHLFSDGDFELVIGVGNKSTGINYGKFDTIPVASSIVSVAGYSAEIVNDGFTFTG